MRSGRKFIFREHEGVWFLWDSQSDISRGRTDKMAQLPPGDVQVFDIDNPPATVSYQPILAVLG